MSLFGNVSAINSTGITNLLSTHTTSRDCFSISSAAAAAKTTTNVFSFGRGDTMGNPLQFPSPRSFISTTNKNVSPLKVPFLSTTTFYISFFFIYNTPTHLPNLYFLKQVVCIDYPRPDLDNTSNFLEAAYLSSTFRAAPRPAKPLKIVIAGAGITLIFISLIKFCLLNSLLSN